MNTTKIIKETKLKAFMTDLFESTNDKKQIAASVEQFFKDEFLRRQVITNNALENL